MLSTLFTFFLSNQIKNRKTLMVSIAGIVPVGIALLITVLRPILGKEDASLSSFFPNFTFLLYFHFLVPLVALFQGTGIIADEVEDRTLPYLIVRPIPRYMIVLAKYLACVFIGGVIIATSLIISYGILALGFSPESVSSDILFLLHSGSILLLELLVYSIVFLLFGGVLRHPMVMGLLFVFGWEKLITYVPGNAKLLTVMNYLQALYPTLSSSRLISLPSLSSQISDVTAIVVLCFLLLTFGGISSILLSVKEYYLDEG